MTKLQEEIIHTIKIFENPNLNVRVLASIMCQRRIFEGKESIPDSIIIREFDNLLKEKLSENLRKNLNRIYNYGR